MNRALGALDDLVTKPKRELDTAAVCRRYRISDTTLDRRLDDRSSRFPQPHWRGRRRFWLESELDAYDAARRLVLEAPMKLELFS
ncbi:hypothetical protein [Mesorhizobium sp. WSM4906]|uniref:helix-turn-helix transcriptional regulator n=1 Tax=Mesorhizobium sp. WSM4906 TaxID=3038546 RepID=UPI002417366F|nr:hypothetical protein [Mesorhizobium sp. WSM4906]WFP76350.1 hypothetical protein QAZ22_00415 [Mesorhizobium sp. WSM4906]